MRKTGLDPKKVIPYSPASTTNAKPFGTTTRHGGRRVIRWRSGRTTIQNSHVVESALECVYATQLCGPRSVTPARKLVAASKKTNRSRKKTESFAPLGPAASGSFFCAHSVLCDLWTGWLVAGIQLLAGCTLNHVPAARRRIAVFHLFFVLCAQFCISYSLRRAVDQRANR